ncbi:RES family NAD+ phosphorylase [Candidatus Palauibacter sp.]|uniref:RES family NAD+ phosphorylase n=1 Tax=Candidatus Palauibacter sp. TaxID=3101350 RepID=UPI003B025059
MELWRITREAHAALDGEGARLYGARWTPPGTPAVYASSHLSLAALEYLVHIDAEDAPDDLVALHISVPDDVTELACSPASLPSDWRQTPPPPECQEIGGEWAGKGDALLLRVPSVLVPEESNVLVNPLHPDAVRVRVVGSRPFTYDVRLLT